MAKRKLKSKEQIAEKERKAAEERLKNVLKNVRQHRNLPEPTIFYKVGDRVQRGNIEDSRVTEVLDDGKILKLHEIVTNNNYGNPYDSERDDYVVWYDVEPYQTDWQKLPIITKKEDIDINYMHRCLDGLLLTYYHFGIDLEPDYQRGNVWKTEDKVKLIDSIFNNVDIGKFVLIHRNWKTQADLYEMLDGKQRLIALIEFKEGRFTYKGKKFVELHPRDKSHFENFPIAWGQIEAGAGTRDVTDEQKYRYFLKLNTGGKPVDPKHIEKVKKMHEESLKEKI